MASASRRSTASVAPSAARSGVGQSSRAQTTDPGRASPSAANTTPQTSFPLDKVISQCRNYEPPAFPLTENAQRNLAKLIRDECQGAHGPRNDIKKAAGKLRDEVGCLNDFLMSEKGELITRKKRAQEDQQEDEDLEEALAELEENVNTITDTMEKRVRMMIDGEKALESLGSSLREIRDEGVNASQMAATEAQTQQSRQSQRQPSSSRRRRRRRMAEDGDVDMEDAGRESGEGEEEEEEEEGEGETQPTLQGASQPETPRPPAPTKRLEEMLKQKKDSYQMKSSAIKYSEHPWYIDFKRVLHDAQYPQGDVPVEHASRWFREEGGPQPGVTGTGEDDDEDDDIAVAREKISTRCPITMRSFVDPVTSKKCPHSFEKKEIFEMIRKQRPPTSHGRRAPQNHVQQVKCPVCDVMLREDDLAPDPVLTRKIARLQQAEANERTQNRDVDEIQSDSDDGDDVDQIDNEADAVRVKTERRRRTVQDDIEE